MALLETANNKLHLSAKWGDNFIFAINHSKHYLLFKRSKKSWEPIYNVYFISYMQYTDHLNIAERIRLSIYLNETQDYSNIKEAFIDYISDTAR